MEIFTLFPIAVAKFKLPRALTSNEISLVVELGKSVRPNSGNTTSINHNVLDLPELRDIREFAEESVRTYFDSIMSPAGDVSPYITLSWLNYTDKNQHHHKHTHGNSILSGVFYVNVDSASDKIHFYNDKHNVIDLTPKSYNVYNSSSWWLPVTNNDLILFPSSLAHGVNAVTSDTTRISLAFNVFVKGQLGSIDNLKWLQL
jgi:uncharacterized protein (TIGR02466 family)